MSPDEIRARRLSLQGQQETALNIALQCRTDWLALMKRCSHERRTIVYEGAYYTRSQCGDCAMFIWERVPAVASLDQESTP